MIRSAAWGREVAFRVWRSGFDGRKRLARGVSFRGLADGFLVLWCAWFWMVSFLLFWLFPRSS